MFGGLEVARIMLIRACARTSSSRSTGAIGADSPSDATGVPPPSPMTSLSDAGPLSDEMPSALPPPASMTDESGDGSAMVYVRRRESAQESSEARADDANTTPTSSSEAGCLLSDWSETGSPLGWMPSSSEAGSPLDWMLAALAPTAVVLPASDACDSQRARG